MTSTASDLFSPSPHSVPKGRAVQEARNLIPDRSEFSVAKAIRDSKQGGGPDGPDRAVVPSNITRPATDINELQGQIGQLIAAFTSHENRLPEPGDTEFFRAYKTLFEEYVENCQSHSSTGATT